MNQPKYPHVHVRLVGEDGNAFAIIGRVRQALRRAGVPEDECDTFSTEAIESPSYDYLLRHVMHTVEVS
jgi:hypothetical protein